MSLVQLTDVSKKYNMGGHDFYALAGVTLSIEHGDFCGLVGPSGSGKTSLLNLVGILDQASAGHVVVFEHETSSLSARQGARLRAENIGFIFQSFYLFPVYTVFENIEYPLLINGIYSKKQREKAVMEALDIVGLADRKGSRPSELSGGQSQRISIARAMVKKPRLILADEPTASLDSQNSFKILDTMESINKEFGTTFVFSTHDSKVINRLRRKIVLEDGRIVSDSKVGVS